MKKALLALAAVSSLAADIHQDDGQKDHEPAALWNVTTDVGVGYAGMYVEETFNNTTENRTGDVKYVGAPGFAVHARAGFNYEFDNQFSIGFGAFGQYNTSEYTNESTATNFSRKSTVYMDWNVGPDVRIGYSNDDNTTFYATAAADWGHYKFSHESTINTVYRTSYTENFVLGVRAGVGALQKFDENWYIQGQFDYSWFDKKTHLATDGASNSFQFSLVSSVFSVGYMF